MKQVSLQYYHSGIAKARKNGHLETKGLMISTKEVFPECSILGFTQVEKSWRTKFIQVQRAVCMVTKAFWYVSYFQILIHCPLITGCCSEIAAYCVMVFASFFFFMSNQLKLTDNWCAWRVCSNTHPLNIRKNNAENDRKSSYHTLAPLSEYFILHT